MRQGPYKSYLPLLTPGDSMETDTQQMLTQEMLIE